MKCKHCGRNIRSLGTPDNYIHMDGFYTCMNLRTQAEVEDEV